MEHVRHEAILDERQEDGSTYRAHLESAARRGHKEAQEKLRGPGAPGELLYLLDWHREISWARRVGQFGLEAFTWSDLHGWAFLTGREPTRDEAKALLMIDLAVRHPGKD